MNTSTVVATVGTVQSHITAIFDTEELAFELGLWLGGLESFLSGGEHVYAEVKDKVRV